MFFITLFKKISYIIIFTCFFISCRTKNLSKNSTATANSNQTTNQTTLENQTDLASPADNSKETDQENQNNQTKLADTSNEKSSKNQKSRKAAPEKLEIFQKAYPDIIFTPEWDSEKEDWKITMDLGTKKSVLYWNNGSMLPESELKNKEKYWTLLYHYDYKKPLADPADFTQEEIEAMKNFGSDENRKNGAGTPMFFFDEIYDSHTRASLEKHIVGVNFLGFKVNVHERLVEPLKKVEEKINQAAKESQEVSDFVKSISKNEGYFWRVIVNTNRKSFHSLGIAIDIRPKSYKGKEVYWSWAKDKNPESWMLTPLKDRWMPPQKVIDIFEDQGFIWGGKWGIWDNMHFEYHPELIYNAKAEE